jgi:hypothetical protein
MAYQDRPVKGLPVGLPVGLRVASKANQVNARHSGERSKNTDRPATDRPAIVVIIATSDGAWSAQPALQNQPRSGFPITPSTSPKAPDLAQANQTQPDQIDMITPLQ